MSGEKCYDESMKFPVVIKQSPFVLVKRIISAEITVIVFLFGASFFTNYETLYKATIGSLYQRYDIFLFLFGALLQLVLTLTILFVWQDEEYRVKEKEIVYRGGFLFRRREVSILLKNITSVEFSKSIVEMLFGYGTISIYTKGVEKPFVIAHIETAQIYADIIKDAIDLSITRVAEPTTKVSILDMILEGEHSRLELKQTFRWDVKQKVTSKVLEKAVMKTVAAFLNTDGGHLIIGITDNGTVYGLDEDYACLVRKDRDGFENHFNQVLKTMLGAEFRQYVQITFEKIENKDICLVTVVPSQKPVYLKMNDEEEFFIRTGNSTTPLKVSGVNSYIETRWKKG